MFFKSSNGIAKLLLADGRCSQGDSGVKELSGLDWLVLLPFHQSVGAAALGGCGMPTCVLPTSSTAFISSISKLELESDLITDLARTSLTEPSRTLALGVGATRSGGCKAAVGSLAGKDW